MGVGEDGFSVLCFYECVTGGLFVSVDCVWLEETVCGMLPWQGSPWSCHR